METLKLKIAAMDTMAEFRDLNKTAIKERPYLLFKVNELEVEKLADLKQKAEGRMQMEEDEENTRFFHGIFN